MVTEISDFKFLKGSAYEVAPQLLGCILERELNGQLLRVKIVEVEAYDQTDPASHTFKGRTARSNTMFGPAGHLYVYFTYGMHYCCNIVTGNDGFGSGVLIRAAEPIDGTAIMEVNRKQTGVNLTNGPAKLCQVLSINREFDGHDLSTSPIRLIPQPPIQTSTISQSVRIGISKARETSWRFYITGNPYVSKTK